MEKMQNDILVTNQNLLKEAQNQSEQLKVIKKSSKSAVRTGKINVLLNYGIYRQTKRR